jgi:hypothetical protein
MQYHCPRDEWGLSFEVSEAPLAARPKTSQGGSRPVRPSPESPSATRIPRRRPHNLIFFVHERALVVGVRAMGSQIVNDPEANQSLHLIRPAFDLALAEDPHGPCIRSEPAEVHEQYLVPAISDPWMQGRTCLTLRSK